MRRRARARWWPAAGARLGLALALAIAGPDDARAAPAPPSTPAPPPAAATTRGRLLVETRIAGDRAPLGDAVVIVTPVRAETQTPPEASTEPAEARSQRSPADGTLRFDDLPVGEVEIVILAPGFARLEHRTTIVADATTQIRAFVVPLEDTPFRTVVRAQPPPRSRVTEHVLTAEEIATVPGSQGDPLRALQNLPGVARPPGGLGVLVIRGADPAQSRIFMAGHALPRAFHILALASVFPADMLDEMRYVPGNFDAAYGNATGGIVVIEPRRGRRDGVHGFGEIDLAASSAMVEGPLGKGSFIVGGQRAYVDAVLATANAVAERVTGDPSSILLPRYYDYHALYDRPLRGGAWLAVRAFGAGDVLKIRTPPELASASAFRLRSDFHRADVAYRLRRQGFTVRLTPSFRYENNRLVSGSDTLRRRRHDAITSARAELTAAIGSRAELTAGTDFELDTYATRDEQLLSTDFGIPGPFVEARTTGLQTALGLYASGVLRLGRLTLRPGVRYGAYAVGPRFAYSIDPRGIADLELGERWRLSLGLGRYSQVRSITDRNEIDLLGQGSGIGGAAAFLPSAFADFAPAVSFGPLDSQLNVREALHASATIQRSLGEAGHAELTGFLRNQHNNVPPLDNGGTNPFDSISRSMGVEALVRQRLSRKLYGWIGYTLVYAELIFLQAPTELPYDRRPSDYDQRHNLVALASYRLPKHWRIGGRFRVVSGLPYTPLIGSVAVPGGHQPIFGHRNFDRLPLSHQLDLRVDKVWIRDRARVTAYVDVQNVYNRVNPEVVLYAADYRSEAGYVGLPIFPSLGVRVDW